MDVVELLDEIADIGRDHVRGGWSRHVFDDAELALRDWFVGHARALGLRVESDGNANIWAWWDTPDAAGAQRGAIAIGSHLDSVPGGGAYDGPLGVASSLAAVARLRSTGFEPTRPLVVAAFAEEEGSRFGIACLGSKLMSGAISAERACGLTDAAGCSFGDVAAEHGFPASELGRDDERIARIAAYVELHVEQGRGLVDLDQPVAVATSILAHGRWRLSFTGEGNHAGTTRMRDRHDPVAAFAATVIEAQRIATARDGHEHEHEHDEASSHPPAARATIGRVVPVPGGTNVIARRVEAWLDARADDDAAVRALVDEILAAAAVASAEQGCTLDVAEESYGALVGFDENLRERMLHALAPRFGAVPALATGAGHDAGVLSDVLPTGMLFVRNPSGVSHAPAEGATDEDCRRGVDALVAVVRELAGADA